MAVSTKNEKKPKAPKNKFKDGDLPSTNEEWRDYVNSLHDAALAERRKYEFQWVVNLSYFLGYQNLVFIPSTGLLAFNDTERVPTSINRIGSFIEARQAKLTKNRPVPRVIPNSNAMDDQRGAKNADKTLLSLWRKIDMENEYDKLIMQMLVCGTAFMQTLWNPNIGDAIMEDKIDLDSGEVEFTEDGDIASEKVFLGEVDSKVLSPFNVLVASESVCDMKDQDWVMTRTHMSGEWLRGFPPQYSILFLVLRERLRIQLTLRYLLRPFG
jgi:hypothetical protein